MKNSFDSRQTVKKTNSWHERTLFREHLISSQFFSKRNAFQIGFTPSLPPLSERLIAHFLTIIDVVFPQDLVYPRRNCSSGSLVLLLKRSSSRQHHLHFFLVFSQVPRLSPRIVCFALGLLQRQTGIAGNVSIYKLLITVGWRTVWTRFSDNRFSKKVQLSRHRGPHRTKKKFSHAICLCLVRVRKVHVLYLARVQSCSRALWRSGLGKRATAPALHVGLRSRARRDGAMPCPAHAPGRFAKA